jgi:hypothetical protein
MEKKNLYDNISYLKEIDEVKFVVGNREDYDWAKLQISTYNLDEKHEVLISPVFGEIEPVKIVNWILEDNLKTRCDEIKKDLEHYNRLLEEQRIYGRFDLRKMLDPNFNSPDKMPRF